MGKVQPATDSALGAPVRDVAGQGSRGGPDHHHHPAAQGAWGRCDGGHLLPGPLGIAGRVHRGSDPVVRGSGSAWSAGPGRWSRSLPGVWADQLTVGEVGSAWVKVGAAAVTPAGGGALVLPRALRAGCSRQCLVGQEMVAQRWREVCLRYCGPGLCPPGRSWGNLPGKSWGGDLCSFLGLSFHISKMGAK